MLASIEPEGDFSRECAGRRIGHSLFATHPTLAFASGSMPVSPPVILATANLFIHRSNILWPAMSHGPENRPSSDSMGPGLCRLLDMDFGEFFFHALG
jgi:hypothetical protein